MKGIATIYNQLRMSGKGTSDNVYENPTQPQGLYGANYSHSVRTYPMMFADGQV